jgi:type II secretory pathway component PulL
MPVALVPYQNAVGASDTTFLDGASAIVMRWGPRWCRRRVAGRPVGAWVLLVGWAAVPVVLAGPVLLRVFR